MRAGQRKCHYLALSESGVALYAAGVGNGQCAAVHWSREHGPVAHDRRIGPDGGNAVATCSGQSAKGSVK